MIIATNSLLKRSPEDAEPLGSADAMIDGNTGTAQSNLSSVDAIDLDPVGCLQRCLQLRDHPVERRQGHACKAMKPDAAAMLQRQQAAQRGNKPFPRRESYGSDRAAPWDSPRSKPLSPTQTGTSTKGLLNSKALAIPFERTG